MKKLLLLAAAALPLQGLAQAAPPAPAGKWRSGMGSNVVSAPAMVGRGPRVVEPPAVINPQDGPGEADLSLWDARGNTLTDLGRFESIAACREAKARLSLRFDQRAWCTVAPKVEPHLGID